MTDIVERLGGPHEWGYRDVTDGTFIPDNAPFEAADEIERLREHVNALRLVATSHEVEIAAKDAEIEALRGGVTLHADARRRLEVEIERLRAAIEWLMKQSWKSIDKDNMEFQVIVTCYVRDALLDALTRRELEPKP